METSAKRPHAFHLDVQSEWRRKEQVESSEQLVNPHHKNWNSWKEQLQVTLQLLHPRECSSQLSGKSVNVDSLIATAVVAAWDKSQGTYLITAVQTLQSTAGRLIGSSLCAKCSREKEKERKREKWQVQNEMNTQLSPLPVATFCFRVTLLPFV